MSSPPSEESYGQAAIGLGFVSEAQVRECVVIQAKIREMGIDDPLGEILVKKRYLTAPQHQAVLKKLGVHTNPIPGYTLHGKIGQGGMGAVYKATQTSVNRPVAIKILNPQTVKDPTFVARFYQEARAAGKLSHKNLIGAIDVGEAGGLYYFVMEFVSGRSARETAAQEGPFPEARALDVASQMAEVLEYVHQSGLVHRDIKPENILIAADGTVKLCDLGLAKSTATEEQSLTQTGFAVGTPYFMSPEQCRGDKDLDIRADLYSLGATLYYLVTGKHPFQGKSALDTMHLHQTAPVPDPRRSAPDLGEDFSRLIQTLMAKIREDRYATPAELLEDLRRIRAGEAASVARQHAVRAHLVKPHATQRATAVRPRTSKPPVALIAGAAAAVVVGIVVLMALPGGKPAPAPPPVVVRPPVERPPAEAPKAAPEPPRETLPAALVRAREASAKDPNDLAALIPLYEKAVEETKGTPHHEATRRVLDGLYRRELEAVDAQSAEAVRKEDFGQAVGILGAARLRHSAADWAAAVDAKAADVRAKASRLFGEVRGAALDARRRKADAEVREAVDRVTRWGLPDLRDELQKALAAVATPEPAAVPVDVSKKWEAAVSLAGTRDFAAATAALEGGDPADLELLRGAGAVHAEALEALRKVARGQKLAIRYFDEAGEPQRIEETVFRTDAHRVEFRKDGAATVVDAGEILADSLAEVWKTRSPKKAFKDGRAAALLCLAEGDPAAARRHLGNAELPERYWGLGNRLEAERAKPDRKEDDARRRYYAAERDFADPLTTVDAARQFAALLKDAAETAFVRRNRAAIAARTEGGREFLLFADDLRGSGTFRLASHAKAAACWTSESDSEAARRAENAVEVPFSVHEGLEYRCWLYVGGCCMETLAFQVQAADGPDPSVALPQPVKQNVVTVTRTHSSHTGQKQPSRWGWVPIPLPKYTAAGARKLLALSDQKGFSVGFAFVSASKAAPPKETELKDLEKARAESGPVARPAPADPSLVGWWRLDERGGATAADASRNRNHGTLRNGPAWAAGKERGALSFDGTDDHVRIPDSASLNSITTAITAAAWVQRQADQEAYRLAVSRQIKTGDENQFWLGWRENRAGFSVATDGSTQNLAGRPLPLGEWVHLAGTYDGTRARLYMNGVEVDSSSHSGPIVAVDRALMIGADEYDAAGSVQEVPKAVIDEVRLYNRALTPAEIAALAGVRPR